MSVPVIDPESSVLSYPQWLTWEHTFSASGAPTSWAIASGSFPTGMTFEPTLAVTGTQSTNQIEATGHGFANGTVLVFSAITGGAGLATGTRYFVVNKTTDEFQLAASVGGAPINFTTDISTGVMIRPGYVVGAAVVPGISKVRLTATNGDGTSAEVLFTIGVEPAAAVPDGNTELLWDMATGNVTVQNSSVVQSAAAADAPLITVKEGDDFMARIRFIKAGTFIELNTSVTDGNLRLVVKEFDPEGEVAASDIFLKQGSGTSTCYLLHAKFDGAALVGSLANYESDLGTFYNGLAEFEVSYENPESIGPDLLVLTSRTFRLRIERDLAANP